MSAINLTIPAIPIVKKRPRFARAKKKVINKINGSIKKIDYVRTYSDQVAEEEKLRLIVQSQVRGRKPYPGAIAYCGTFYMPIPVNTSKKEREKMLSGETHHTKKKDKDNLEKFINDCLNGIIWVDDCQVVASFTIKRYDDNPRTELTIIPAHAMTAKFWSDHFTQVYGGQGRLFK